MTTIFTDPQTFAEEQLAGFVSLYPHLVRAVPGGVVAHPAPQPQVAVVVGGGSGHYPAFAGVVGPGFASGAVVGNIFTSPSAAQAYSVAKAAEQGRGVIFSFGNYAGDTMNFGLAAQRLRAEGIDARIVVVTDDVASAPEIEQRRGIAGDFAVFKAMGALAASGANIDEVERIGRQANEATRTLGLAFSGCTMPGAAEPLFEVPAGQMGLGLGIHGEPGIEDIDMMNARDLAQLLVGRLLEEEPKDLGDTTISRVGTSSSGKVAPILNGLGTTKYEELFLLWNEVRPLLEKHGLELVEPEVGELVTSLDMGGLSLTLQWLNNELEWAWRADAYTPAYRKVRSAENSWGVAEPDVKAARVDAAPSVSVGASATAADTPTSRVDGRFRALTHGVIAALGAVQVRLHEQAEELGRIDAVAGDGDHGRGMVKGIDAALNRARELNESAPAGVEPSTLLGEAGRAWAEYAGGTSGVLWGAGIEAAAKALQPAPIGGPERSAAQTAVDAVHAFGQAITSLGGAKLGDKTMVDALIPFTQELQDRLGLEPALLSLSDLGTGNENVGKKSAAQHGVEEEGVEEGNASQENTSKQRPAHGERTPIKPAQSERTQSQLTHAWRAAAVVANHAAQETAHLRPKLGRARPLAEKSIGTPDAGAVSMALILDVLGTLLEAAQRQAHRGETS